MLLYKQCIAIIKEQNNGWALIVSLRIVDVVIFFKHSCVNEYIHSVQMRHLKQRVPRCLLNYNYHSVIRYSNYLPHTMAFFTLRGKFTPRIPVLGFLSISLCAGCLPIQVHSIGRIH